MGQQGGPGRNSETWFTWGDAPDSLTVSTGGGFRPAVPIAPVLRQPLTLFTSIVQTGSFNRAVAGIDIPRPTAINAIKALETLLGVRLLERTTRQVRPTLDG